MDRSLIIGLVLVTVLGFVAAADSEEDTVTYMPSNQTEVNVDVSDDTGNATVGKLVKCYDCSYYIRGTNREGNPACEFIDPLLPLVEDAGMQECNGFCVKQIITQNALMSYLYVTRYCMSSCVEETTVHYGNDMITTCCDEDYCNAATTNTAAAALTILATAMLTLAGF